MDRGGQALILPVYLKKSTPGLTASRNAGIKISKGDIVFFFDDDVILTSQYIKTLLKVYADDKDMVIGGVCGRDINTHPRNFKNHVRRLMDVIFLNSGFSEGKILPSGFFTDYGDTRNESMKQREVEFLTGCSFSFRKEVFNEFHFDTKEYLNYGMGEDKDFSFRVSSRYKLVYEPSAELFHFHSPSMRPNHFMTGRMQILFVHKFFTTHGKKRTINKILFYYALTGNLVIIFILCATTWKRSAFQYLKGMLKAFSEIISNKNAML